MSNQAEIIFSHGSYSEEVRIHDVFLRSHEDCCELTVAVQSHWF